MARTSRKRAFPVKNPFGYGDTRTMRIWLIAQSCFYMMKTLWEDPEDTVRLTREAEVLNRYLSDWLNYLGKTNKSRLDSETAEKGD